MIGARLAMFAAGVLAALAYSKSDALSVAACAVFVVLSVVAERNRLSSADADVRALARRLARAENELGDTQRLPQ